MRIPKGVKAAAAIILIIAVAVFVSLSSPRHYLTLRERNSGDLIARYPMEEGDRFSVEFKHSVNLSPLIDVYEIQDGNIYVEETIYYHFGAGVQTQLNEGETLTYNEDGAMVVGNIHQKRNNMLYIVGTIYDHMLTVNGEVVNLRQLCGRNGNILFNYEFHWF